MLELSAELRQETGHKNKQLRKQGMIPAVLYGHKIKNILLAIRAVDFKKAYQEAGESTLIKLKIDNKETKSDSKKERIVLIHAVEIDPVSDEAIHADFYQVKMDEVIKVEVPLVFVGKSLAVERENGLLIKSIQHIEVEALPQDLPHNIEVDISPLNSFDDNIYVKDLKAPDKVKILAEPNEVVASVIPPRTQEELKELEEKPEEEIEGIKVEGEGLPVGEKEEEKSDKE